jgi:hypothetical protein
MSARSEVKLGAKPSSDLQQQVSSERRRADTKQFRLQVDRQTKSSYASYEAAEQAGLRIKKSHPIVSVTVYDSVGGISKSIDLPNSSGEPAS